MSELTATIETQEHRLMRAWMARDPRELKKVTSGKFVMLVGSVPPVILDKVSWLESASSRFVCNSYRFGPIYVRDLGGPVMFATNAEIDARIAGEDWSGQVWLTDLWRKGRIGRQWRIVQRVISRTEAKTEIPAAIRSLQLWR
jgi:hypothetical protein